MTTYKNSFYDPRWSHDKTYTTNAKPTEYAGYLIYRRLEQCFDVVKDGVCVAQYAGLSGAKKWVDEQ